MSLIGELPYEWTPHMAGFSSHCFTRAYELAQTKPGEPTHAIVITDPRSNEGRSVVNDIENIWEAIVALHGLSQSSTLCFIHMPGYGRTYRNGNIYLDRTEDFDFVTFETSPQGRLNFQLLHDLIVADPPKLHPDFKPFTRAGLEALIGEPFPNLDHIEPYVPEDQRPAPVAFMNDDETEMTIRVRLRAKEGESPFVPWGDFEMALGELVTSLDDRETNARRLYNALRQACARADVPGADELVELPTPQGSTRVYEGRRAEDGTAIVTVNGEPLHLRRDLYDHGNEYNWGYNGSGPATLALAILADYLGDPDLAVRYHQKFKQQIIAHIPQEENWQLWPDAIARFIAARDSEQLLAGIE